MRFEWDPAKDKSNRAKHGLSFDEATELFKSGVNYLEIYDVLRILSARMATKKERQCYEKFEGERDERRDS